MTSQTTTYTPEIGRQIAITLFVTQGLASAALIANGTVNSIVSAELGGTDTLAGLPGTLLLLGAACASYPAGRLMDLIGRRRSLALGFLIGGLGMTIVESEL